MTRGIPATVAHTHTDHDGVWTDDEIIAHVKDQHDLNGQVWLTNSSNLTVLITEHEQGHHGDPISF